MSMKGTAVERNERPDYGIDAPNILRNMFLAGVLLWVLVWFTPPALHLGSVTIFWHYAAGWTGSVLLVESFLYMLYVRRGKLRHRDFMLNLRTMARR